MTIMKKGLLILALFAVVISASAQRDPGSWSLIPRLGVSIANMTDNDLVIGVDGSSISSKYKAGMVGGVDVEYQVIDKASVILGAYYSMQGCRYADCEYTSDGKTSYGYKNNRTNLQYINVPLLLNCYVAQGLAVKAGVQLGFLLDAKSKVESTPITKNKDGSQSYGDMEKMSTSFTDNCHSVDFSIPVGVSYEYMNVILDARYNFGLSKIYKVDGLSSKNRNFTVSVGYRL
jgi:hypothetical protein